ncbi:hypothetical protein C8R47DRAFT_1297986, partial [Mycena vitilis]
SVDRAFALISDLGLHIPKEIDRDARSKLTIVKTESDKSKSATNPEITFRRRRRLFQCQCGTDHTAGRQGGKDREIAWPNVGCSVWIRLVSTHDERDEKNPILLTIDEIAGNFSHSAACLATETMDRNPRIPLHPELRKHALSLLEMRLPLPQMRHQCRTWAHKRWGTLAGNSSFRYVLTSYESSSLYRTIAAKSGIPQRTAPENNLDLWFRSVNPIPPDPRLTASCLSYTPCVPGVSERFCLVLSTPEQQLLAWKFGHQKLMLMDLTFGFCNGRALLAILMVIDDQGKGLPVAQILFTAKKEAKAVHADYNKEILDELIGAYKTGMGTNVAGEEFHVEVGITDNDPRERYALDNRFHLILLLLCIFHVWQAWRNALNKYLRPIPQGDDRQSVRRRLGRFLMRLLKEINVFEEAIAAYNEEVAHFTQLGRQRNPLAKSQSKSALAFLAYLQSYLKHRDFWRSWSLAGAEEAARRLGVPVSQIPRTTNHLESFNGRIKGTYFAPHIHSGKLPRIDLWILLLITAVLPTFFDDWAEKRETKVYFSQMRQAAPP